MWNIKNFLGFYDRLLVFLSPNNIFLYFLLNSRLCFNNMDIEVRFGLLEQCVQLQKLLWSDGERERETAQMQETDHLHEVDKSCFLARPKRGWLPGAGWIKIDKDEGGFSGIQAEKFVEKKIGNDRNDLKDKGNEQKILWAKMERKHGWGKRTFGRMPFFHQAFK